MNNYDTSFIATDGLERALELLRAKPSISQPLPDALPERGVGEVQALESLAPHILIHRPHWRIWTHQHLGLPGQQRCGMRA